MSKYIVFDLEMCRVPRGIKLDQFGSKTELIQIGAVMLDENYSIVDTFKSFVHPEYGSIDPFIERLTGIKREDVENAPSSEEALKAFQEWIPYDGILVSWSSSDMYQIVHEMEGKNFSLDKLEGLFDTWIDCQWEFGNIIDSDRQYKLSEALSISNIYFDDGEHDGLVDAKNTALLFKKMETEEEFQLSPYLMVC